MPELIAGKYEVLQVIGRGGMGTVYKAVQRSLDRVVAIKMLSEELASDPEFRARFQQEATVVARLNHPNIVQVYDIEPHNHTFCIIMEFVEGENLQAKIDRDVTVPEAEAVRIGVQVSKALQYAHSQGIVHRDIKPDNILVTPKGVAKVMDFGIARFNDSKLKTQTGISMGTPKFMSPEQVTGKNVDGQTDLYSLGVCLYYCLAGRPPFDGENAIAVATRHLYEQPEPPSRFNTSLTPAVEKVIMKALEKQKPERYQNGTEMASALETTLGMKTPIRLAEENDSSFFSGATQRIAVGEAVAGGGVISRSGASGVALATPASGFDANIDVKDPTPKNRTRGRGWSLETPVDVRPTPKFEEFGDVSDEGSESEPPESAAIRSLGKWWPAVIGGLFVVAAIVIIVLTRGGGQKNADEAERNGRGRVSNAPRDASPGAAFTEAMREADLRSAKDVAGAIRALEDFRAKYGDAHKADIADRIAFLENQYSRDTNRDELAKRRERLGSEYMKTASDTDVKRYAVAAVYLKEATTLSSGSINRLTALNLQQMDSEVKKQLQSQRPDELARAARLIAEARQLAASALSAQQREEAESKYLDAVSLDPRNGEYWLQLGDYYRDRKQTDDARVMYLAAQNYGQGEAVSKAMERQQSLKGL